MMKLEVTIEEQVKAYQQVRNDKLVGILNDDVVIFKSEKPIFEGKPYHVLMVGVRGLHSGKYDYDKDGLMNLVAGRIKSDDEIVKFVEMF